MIGLDQQSLLTLGALLNLAALIGSILAFRRGSKAYWPAYVALIGGALMFWGFSASRGPVAVGGIELLGILSFLVGLGLAGYTFVRQPPRPPA